MLLMVCDYQYLNLYQDKATILSKLFDEHSLLLSEKENETYYQLSWCEG